MRKFTSLHHFLRLSPYEFEKVVAKVWEDNGWITEVTKGSNDYGIDVLARKRGDQKYTAIQAKRYDTDTKIGGPEVRKYATLYQQDNSIENVILVTTTSFTSQAEELGSSLGVSLVTGPELVRKATRLNKTTGTPNSISDKKSRHRMRNKLNSNPRQALDEILEQHKKGEISKKKFEILKRTLVDEIREIK